MAGRPTKKPTCGQLVVLGLCPKKKNHPLGGWMIIYIFYNYLIFQCVDIIVAWWYLYYCKDVSTQSRRVLTGEKRVDTQYGTDREKEEDPSGHHTKLS